MKPQIENPREFWTGVAVMVPLALVCWGLFWVLFVLAAAVVGP